MSDSSPFDQILALLETRGLLGNDVCDVVALECAAGIRADHLSMESMDDYLAYAENNPTELKELVTSVVEARARLEADELVPEAEVETVVGELEATIDALEQANQDRRSTVDDLSEVDHELTLAATELKVVTGQLDERTREVERLNDFVQGILAVVQRPMIVVDHDRVVRAWNEAVASILGTSVKEAVGRPIDRLAHAFKTGPIADALAGALQGNQPASTSDLNLPGHPSAHVVITGITAVDGETVGAILRVDLADPD